MSQETRETVLSVIGLAVFLVLAYFIGATVSRFKNARFRKAWAPLMPMLEGAIIADDGGGASASWLTGTYGGHRVQARMNPERNSGETGPRFNDFSVALADVPGEQDWTFEFRASVAPGKSPWLVSAGSTAVAQRLERAGIEARLPGLGYPTVTYRTGTRTIEYRVDITPSLAPSPDQFKRTLEFLAWLHGVNQQANTGT
jgi:hypothetical protein